MNLITPHSLDHALAAMTSDHPPTPIAGGTDLLVSWHHRPKHDLTLLDLSPLEKTLRPYRLETGFLELGALTTYWDVIRSPEISREFPLLAQAARQVGAIQIQTRGTWAGNIANASPAADGVPVLMAYAASVILQSAAGQREIPLDQYYTAYKKTVRRPDELIAAIRIPRRPRKLEYFHKVGARSAQAITKVGVAVTHDQSGWRVVANSVAPCVCRCPAMESALNSAMKFNSPDDIGKIIAEDISPIDDIRSTAAYRTNVLARLLHHRLSARAV